MLRRVLRAPLRMGGGGHGHAADAHGHGSRSALAEAYDHSEAKLFGESHGHGHGSGKREEWELPTYLAIGGAAVIGLSALWYRPSTNPHDWARDEAEERLRRRDAGLPVEFGVNYAALRKFKESKAISEEEAEKLEGGAVGRNPR